MDEENSIGGDAVSEQNPDEQAIEAEQAEASGDEEDESLPFPNARVIRLVREELKSGKQIRGEVKTAVNIWLGDLLKKLAREMDQTQYGSIGMADFQRATKPFDMIDDLVKDRERLSLAAEKLKQDSDHIKREMDRFFVAMTGKLPKQEG